MLSLALRTKARLLSIREVALPDAETTFAAPSLASDGPGDDDAVASSGSAVRIDRAARPDEHCRDNGNRRNDRPGRGHKGGRCAERAGNRGPGRSEHHGDRTSTRRNY